MSKSMHDVKGEHTIGIKITKMHISTDLVMANTTARNFKLTYLAIA